MQETTTQPSLHSPLPGAPEPSGDARAPGLRWIGGVLALQILLALAFTWPLAKDMDRWVPGPPRRASERPSGDGLQYLWNVWWLHRAAAGLQDPYECPEMFHPLGARLYFDTLTVWNGLVALPFAGQSGPVRAANLMLLLNLVLCGLLATGLGWEATRSRAGALVTGLAFGLAPVVFGRLAGGQWNFSTTAPLALGAWLMLRLAHRPTTGRAVLLGLGLGAAGHSEYTYLLFLLVLSGLMTGAALLRRGPAGGHPGRFIAGLLLAGAVLCLLMAPVLAGAKRELDMGGSQTIVRRGMRDYSADLAEYLIPNPDHPLLRGWSELQAWLLQNRIGGEARRAAPGVAVLALAAIALIRRRHWPRGRAGFWAFVAVVAVVLSCGGTLRVFGHETVPLIYRYLWRLPIVGYVRAPGRYCVLAQLAFAVLAGIGAAELLRRGRRGLLVLLAAGMLFEFLPAPIPRTNVGTIPQPVRTLASSRERGAVWEIGVLLREGLLLQTVHQRPTVGGYYSRIWDLDGVPLWSLETLIQRGIDGAPAGSEALLRDVLEAWKVRFILAAPTAPALVVDHLDRARWVIRRERADGWSLYQVMTPTAEEWLGAEARLLAWIGNPHPGVEPAVFLALRQLAPEGPQLLWNPSSEALEGQREWWREWGRRRAAVPPGAQR